MQFSSGTGRRSADSGIRETVAQPVVIRLAPTRPTAAPTHTSSSTAIIGPRYPRRGHWRPHFVCGASWMVCLKGCARRSKPFHRISTPTSMTTSTGCGSGMALATASSGASPMRVVEGKAWSCSSASGRRALTTRRLHSYCGWPSMSGSGIRTWWRRDAERNESSIATRAAARNSSSPPHGVPSTSTTT